MKRFSCFTLSIFIFIFSCVPVPVHASTLAVGAFTKILLNLVVTGGVTYEIGKALGLTGSNTEIMYGGADAIKKGEQVDKMVLPTYSKDLSNVFDVDSLMDTTGMTKAQANSIMNEYNRYLSSPSSYVPDWDSTLMSAISSVLKVDNMKYMFTTVSYIDGYIPFPSGWEDVYNAGGYTHYFRYSYGYQEKYFMVLMSKEKITFSKDGQHLFGRSIYQMENPSKFPGHWNHDKGDSSRIIRWNNGTPVHYYDYSSYPELDSMVKTFDIEHSIAPPTVGTGDNVDYDKFPHIPFPIPNGGFINDNLGSLVGTSDGVLDTVVDGVVGGSIAGTDDLVNVGDIIIDIPIEDVVGGLQAIKDVLTGGLSVSVDNVAGVDKAKGLDFTPILAFGSDFTKKFPFSLPWDLMALIELFLDEPSPPKFELDFTDLIRPVLPNIKPQIMVLDMAQFSFIAEIIRLYFKFMFIYFLIKMTPTLIKH